MQEGNPELREPESFVMGGKQAFFVEGNGLSSKQPLSRPP